MDFFIVFIQSCRVHFVFHHVILLSETRYKIMDAKIEIKMQNCNCKIFKNM